MKGRFLFFLILTLAVAGGTVWMLIGRNEEEPSSTSQVTTNTNTSGLTGDARALALGYDGRRLADIHVLVEALNRYRDDNAGRYPVTLEALSPDYLATIPRDPKTDLPYRYTPMGTEADRFELAYELEVGISGVSAGTHIANPDGIEQP